MSCVGNIDALRTTDANKLPSETSKQDVKEQILNTWIKYRFYAYNVNILTNQVSRNII
jgi:hypothetical protein